MKILLTKAVAMLKFYGPIGLLLKAWEKLVIDRRRFRSNCVRRIPYFPNYDLPNAMESILDDEKPDYHKTIYYLVHCFYPESSGGTERFVYNLAKQQQIAGCTVRIITFSQLAKSAYTHQHNEILYHETNYQDLPVTIIRYSKTPLGLYYKTIEENSALKSFAKNYMADEVPDIVHCVYPQPFAGFLAACREMKIPYLVTLTDFNIFCHYATMVKNDGEFCAGCQNGMECERNCSTMVIPNPQQRFQNAQQILENAKVVTVPSKFVAAIIHQEFPNISPYVIAHGIDEKFCNKLSRKQTKRFVYAGTLSELKGVHLLIEAFCQIEGDVSLTVFGQGNPAYCNKLRQIAKNDKRIQFFGPVSPEKMQQIYQQNDCVIVPSIWYETYNFVLREALACGCLVVVSRMGAMPEAIDEGINGFTFYPGDVEGLKETLEKAVVFEWDKYCQKKFVSLADESRMYQKLYKQMLTQ